MHNFPQQSSVVESPAIGFKDVVYWFVLTLLLIALFAFVLLVGSRVLLGYLLEIGFDQFWIVGLLGTGISSLFILETVKITVMDPKGLDWHSFGWRECSAFSYVIAGCLSLILSLSVLAASLVLASQLSLSQRDIGLTELEVAVGHWLSSLPSKIGQATAAVAAIFAFLTVWYRFFRQRFGFWSASIVSLAVPLLPFVILGLFAVSRDQTNHSGMFLVVGGFAILCHCAAVILSCWLFERYQSLRPPTLFYLVFTALAGS